MNHTKTLRFESVKIHLGITCAVKGYISLRIFAGWRREAPHKKR